MPFRYWKKAIRSDPKSAVLFSNLIYLYISEKKFVELPRPVAILTSAKNPQDAFSHNLLGKVYGAQKAYTKAEKAFQQAVEL